MNNHQNVVIIGSGPAGLTAAIYAARANLHPLIIEGFQSGGMPGGQLMTTGLVENFPGFPDGIDGQHLMANMRQQAINAGASSVMEDVERVSLSKQPFTVETASETYSSDALIIATGATARRLSLESEKVFWGKGVSACAVCDGALPEFRNKPLAVIGGGDSAVEEADHLTQFASKVYLIHRRNELRASEVMQRRAKEHTKIEILWNTTVDAFMGERTLTGLKLKDTTNGSITELPVAGAFEAIGHIPNTKFLSGQLDLDNEGYISITPGRSTTSVEGIFAAGDVKDPVYRQAVSAAGSGCMAALEAQRWLSLNH